MCSLEESMRDRRANEMGSYVCQFLGYSWNGHEYYFQLWSHLQLHNGDRSKLLKHSLASRHRKDEIHQFGNPTFLKSCKENSNQDGNLD